VNKNLLKKLPTSPGVYIFLTSNEKIIYIGKSISIKKRVSSYFTGKNLGTKTKLLVEQIKDIKFIKVFSEFEALLLESELIKKHQPFFNIEAKDDKSPIYIKITSDKIPLISTVRRPSKYSKDFIKGPFKSTKTARDVLKIVRRIFSYCQHKNPKKPCLYVHLGLCTFPDENDQKLIEYIKNISNIKKFLSGKNKQLIKNLVTEMKSLSASQKYEEADKVKKQIESIQSLLSTYHAPAEFLARPTLVDDLALTRLIELKKRLNLDKTPNRIECYDISNISGKFATGSMAVFEKGQPAKSQYRKFKIK